MPVPEIPNSELLLVISDMELWWNRGVSATSAAQVLGNKIKAHLEARTYTEGDTLYAIPDAMMARLMNVMFRGPTEEIREAARLVLRDYIPHPQTPTICEDPDHA